MKNLFKIIGAFCALLIFAAPVTNGIAALSAATGAPQLLLVLSLAAILFVTRNVGKSTADANIQRADLPIQIWARYIIARLLKDNQFLNYAFNDDEYVLNGRIVHIPQIGSKPTVVKNRNVYPATAVRRADGEVLYALDEYTTDPTHIPNIDSIHLSYDKADSVLGDHMDTLTELVGDDMILKWAANATIIKTSGDAVAPITGQTGNRKGMHHKDFKKLMVRMNASNVPKKDRYALLDDNMYEYFYDSLSENQTRDFSKYVDAENGIVGKLHGFNFLTRSSVAATASDNSVKALGAALGASDNLASFVWQKNTVAKATGEKKLFQKLDDPLYYGDIHSALVMAGGRVRRQDGLGTYLLTQDAA